MADGDDRLESWKEIAAYLGREVRTVQLWEKSEGLPVHRHQHARQGSVYAFRSELDAWRQSRKPPRARRALARPAVIVAAAAALVVLAAGVGWSIRVRPVPTSVVVLPFLDLSPAHDQEYFADGLTEEIINTLSGVGRLHVVARTSAFAFKGRNLDVREIGKTLGVEAVLEGSVRTSGDQLRVTAQLDRVSDGTHLWSRTYDRDMRDLFAVQDEIAIAIAGELKAGEVPRRTRPVDLDAWRLNEEARYLFNEFQPPDSNFKAIDRYQQAIRRDPQFALAYAGLADAYAYLAENFVLAPKDVMPSAKQAAEKAVALDPASAEAHTSLGAVKLDYDWDVDAAQQELRRALELNPGLAWARHWYAHSLEAQGRMEDALREMRAALALDPLDIPIHWDIGAELMSLHRYDEADAHLAKAMDLFPNVSLIEDLRAEALYRKHDVAAAHAVIEQMKRRSSPEEAGEPYFVAFLGIAAAREGRTSEAAHAVDVLESLRQTRYVEPMLVVELCSVLKDREGLARWMTRVVDDRSTLRLYMPGIAKNFLDDPEAAALAVRP